MELVQEQVNVQSFDNNTLPRLTDDDSCFSRGITDENYLTNNVNQINTNKSSGG